MPVSIAKQKHGRHVYLPQIGVRGREGSHSPSSQVRGVPTSASQGLPSLTLSTPADWGSDEQVVGDTLEEVDRAIGGLLVKEETVTTKEDL